MFLTKAIDGFLLEMDAGGYAASTKTLYGMQLSRLNRFLGDPQLEAVKPEDLVRFLNWMRTEFVPTHGPHKGERCTPAYIDNHWKCIRAFFKWCHKVIGLPRPDLDLPRPKYESPEIIPFSKDEVEQMLKACEFSREFQRLDTKAYRIRKTNALRDRAIVLAFLDTGLRLGELVRLRVKDCDMESGALAVLPYSTGRKTKPRTVYLGKIARRALWLYLSKRDDYDGEDALFGASYDAVKQMVINLGERTGIPDVHAHRFRHTFAIEYLRGGGDVFTLQRLLGHRSLDMTTDPMPVDCPRPALWYQAA